MPANDFALTWESNTYSYEGPKMGKFQIRGKRRARVQKLQELLIAQSADDAKPAAASAKEAKIKVFDPSIEGMTAAYTLLQQRCAEVLALVG